MSATKSFLLLLVLCCYHDCCFGLFGLDDDPNIIYLDRSGVNVSFPTSNAEKLASYLDFEKKTIITTFGLNGVPTGPAMVAITDALKIYTDVNILMLDWSEQASVNFLVPIDYTIKVLANVKQVGDKLGAALLKFIQLGIQMANIVLIGHSLGCSVMGRAGNYVKSNSNGEEVQLIWALDPSGALYSIKDGDGLVQNPLQPDSAVNVYALHTDFDGYGTRKAVGQVDFMANYNGSGYTLQPGCTVKANLLSTDEKYRCSHDRSWRLWISSWKQVDAFPAQHAASGDTWLAGGGDPNNIAYLRLAVTEGASGLYFFRTTSTDPYYLGIEGSKPAS